MLNIAVCFAVSLEAPHLFLRVQAVAPSPCPEAEDPYLLPAEAPWIRSTIPIWVIAVTCPTSESSTNVWRIYFKEFLLTRHVNRSTKYGQQVQPQVTRRHPGEQITPAPATRRRSRYRLVTRFRLRNRRRFLRVRAIFLRRIRQLPFVS